MSEQKPDPSAAQSYATDVDQACATIKAHLTLPRDKLLTEIINYCITFNNQKNYSKLEDILLVYLEKQDELPMLDYFIVDNLIAILLAMCEKKVPLRAPKAFVTFAKFLINVDKLSGNLIFLDRFKYSVENIQKLSVPIYLSNRLYQEVALELSVFLLEHFSECQISHITKEPEQIEWIAQAEKRVLNKRLKDAINQEIADKEFLIQGLGEANNKILRLSRQIEDIREIMGEVRIKKDSGLDLAETQRYLAEMSHRYRDREQPNSAEEYERFYSKVKDIDQRLDKEIGVLKRDYVNQEAYKIDRAGSSRDVKQLWHELELLKEAEIARKNIDYEAFIQALAAKKPWLYDISFFKEDIATVKADLEMKIKGLDKKGSDKDFLNLEIRETQTEKDVKALKEKIREMEVGLEANLILVTEAGGKNSLSNLIRDSSAQAAVIETIHKEVKIIGEQQEVFANVLESISKDFTDFKIAQDHISEDFRRKLMKLEEDQIIYVKRLHERDISPGLINDSSKLKLAEPSKGTANIPKEKPKIVPEPENVSSVLGSRLSDLEDTYKTQMFKQVQSTIANIQRKIIDDTKYELESKFVKQSEEINFIKHNLENQLSDMTLNLNEIQNRSQAQSKTEQALKKDMQEIKSRVSAVETKDIYSARFETLWSVIQSLSKHLGIKVDPKNGELELLKESNDKISSPGKEKTMQIRVEAGAKQDKVEFLKENLNLLADKLRIYREIINSVTNQSHELDLNKKHKRELDLENLSLEEACGQVVTLEELASVVRELTLIHGKDITQLRNAVDENAIAQNDFNSSVITKIQDLEIAIDSNYETMNTLQDDFTNFVAQESQNVEIGITKREGLRKDLDKLSTRVEELSDSLKQLKDPLAVRRLQNIILNSDKPGRGKQGADNADSEELSERMGAMEFLMWRYARNFVEPEAQKKVSKIGRITVPVYEKLENLMFLIKNCGFIEPKTIRHAIRSFKEALSRLGRRCAQEKQDAYEEIWKLIQTTVDHDTVQYYYILEVFYSLLNEEKNNMDRAYEASVFEFFFDILRKQQGSQPARVCMLKILWCLSKTEAHLDFIQRSNLIPDILTMCKPILDSYGKGSSRDSSPAASPLHHVEDKNQLFSFESSELSEIDGMFVRTALVYYSLKFIHEIFRREASVVQMDLTYFIQSLLGLLKKSMLLNNIRELSVMILHRISFNSHGSYNQILSVPEYLDILDGVTKDPNVSMEVNNLAYELVCSLKGVSMPKPKSAVQSKVPPAGIPNQVRTRPLKSSGSPTQREYQPNQIKLPQVPQRRNVAPYQKLVTTKIFEGMGDRSEGTAFTEGTYYRDRREKTDKMKPTTLAPVSVMTKTGLMTAIPRDKPGQQRNSRNTAASVHNSFVDPSGEHSMMTFDDYLQRSKSKEGSFDYGTRPPRQFTEEGERGGHNRDTGFTGRRSTNLQQPKAGYDGSKEKVSSILKGRDRAGNARGDEFPFNEEGAVVSRLKLFEGNK